MGLSYPVTSQSSCDKLSFPVIGSLHLSRLVSLVSWFCVSLTLFAAPPNRLLLSRYITSTTIKRTPASKRMYSNAPCPLRSFQKLIINTKLFILITRLGF